LLLIVSTARLTVFLRSPHCVTWTFSDRKAHASLLARSLRQLAQNSATTGTSCFTRAYEAHNRMLWPMRTFARSALDFWPTPAPAAAAMEPACPDTTRSDDERGVRTDCAGTP